MQGCLCVPGPVLVWTVLLLAVVLGSVSFLLCHRRACRKWIQQSEWMCPWGQGEGRVSALSSEALRPTPLPFQSSTCATPSRPSGPSWSLWVSVQMCRGGHSGHMDTAAPGPGCGAPCNAHAAWVGTVLYGSPQRLDGGLAGRLQSLLSFILSSTVPTPRRGIPECLPFLPGLPAPSSPLIALHPLSYWQRGA